MVVYITGASGYLGNSLTKYFADLGNIVIALCRKNVFSHQNIQFSYYSLGDEIDKKLPKPDVCIHCAYDLKTTKKSEIYNKNVLGSLSLIKQLNSLNCKTIIHISSISAFDGCKSKYGQTKLLIENITSKHNGISIRPGLIYGGENLGLIGKLSSISKSIIVPMIGSGNYKQYPTKIEFLCKTIYEITNNKYNLKQNVFVLSSMQPITLKKIIKTFNSKIIIIPIFWQIPFILLFLIEKLNIKIPFKSDSIKSLVFSNKSPDFNFMQENKIIFNKYTI